MRVVEQAAAHVVAVVGIAVVGRAGGDDRLQRRRPVARDLQRVEAAPGDAHHADRAAAPGLRGEPGDHLDGVGLLLRQIFVGEQAVGIAGAAHVDAHGRHSRGRRNRHASGGRAAPCRRGADRADIRGSPAPDRSLGVLRQPDRRGKPRAVGKHDPFGRDGADAARETRFVISMLASPGLSIRSGGNLPEPTSNCKLPATRLRCRHRRSEATPFPQRPISGILASPFARLPSRVFL